MPSFKELLAKEEFEDRSGSKFADGRDKDTHSDSPTARPLTTSLSAAKALPTISQPRPSSAERIELPPIRPRLSAERIELPTIRQVCSYSYCLS